jgi:hypothetical protein
MNKTVSCVFHNNAIKVALYVSYNGLNVQVLQTIRKKIFKRFKMLVFLYGKYYFDALA